MTDETQELDAIFDSLIKDLQECRKILSAGYVSEERVKDWNQNMKDAATTMNFIYTEALRHLTKITI